MFRVLIPILILSLFLSACAGAEIIPAPTGPAPTLPASVYETIQATPVSTGNMTPQSSSSTPNLDDNPYAPAPGDEALLRGPAFLEPASQLMTRESLPPQLSLHLMGNLPDPCHHLRVQINQPNAQNRIDIEVYSVAEKDKVCVSMLQPFDVQVRMGTYPTGSYTVYLNGEKLGEFST